MGGGGRGKYRAGDEARDKGPGGERGLRGAMEGGKAEQVGRKQPDAERRGGGEGEKGRRSGAADPSATTQPDCRCGHHTGRADLARRRQEQSRNAAARAAGAGALGPAGHDR